MQKTKKLYERFQQAIITGAPGMAVPDIRPHPRLDAKAQAAIYSNGYMVRLRQALEDDYPALGALLGEEAFKALAAQYIRSHPSVYYSLDDYTGGFVDHVILYGPHEFAGELARLEQAIADVFTGPETPPLSPSALAGLTPEAFGAMTLQLRGALRLMAFTYPASDWLDAQRGVVTPPVPEARSNWLCVLRHDHEVRRISLEKPAFTLLSAIRQGATVAEALEVVASQCPDQLEIVAKELQPWFSGWVAGGVFAA